MSVVEIREDGKTTIFTINRPDNRNTINAAVTEELYKGFAEFDASDQLVAIITGAGDEFFSAGGDIFDPPTQLWKAMPTLGLVTDKPVIAAVNGRCAGASLSLMAMCDLCIAAENAVFHYPEARVGVGRGLGATFATRIPHKFAMEMLLLAREIPAQRAYEMGLVNQVVPPTQALRAALEMARDLEGMAPLVLKMFKRFVVEHVLVHSPAEEAARSEREVDIITRSDDRAEGIASRREGRKPVFVGR